MGDSIETLLAEREKTHGDYASVARVTQSIKRVMEVEPSYEELSDEHKQALEMIVHKIGRVIAGDPNIPDHWDDIAGYAKLASQAVDTNEPILDLIDQDRRLSDMAMFAEEPMVLPHGWGGGGTNTGTNK